MKHSTDFPFANALPDAPLAMPRQQLGYQYSLFQIIRATVSSWARR